MTENKTLSQQLCELCGIEYEKEITDPLYRALCDHGDPRCSQLNKTIIKCLDFEKPKNKIKLIETLIKSGCSISMCEKYCAIGGRHYDFLNDFYDTEFEVEGNSLLDALFNYLKRYIKRYTRFRQNNGTMSPYIDTSHILQRDDCYDENGFDEYIKHINIVKQAIASTEWEY